MKLGRSLNVTVQRSLKTSSIWDRYPLKCARIAFHKPFSASLEKRKAFRVLIEEKISAGIIEKSTARGACPELLVPKPNKTYRLVVDYRPLNRILRRKLYPSQQVDDYLEALRGHVLILLAWI